jgi:hypothetical protein
MVKLAHISHGKLSLNSSNNLAKEPIRGCCQHDVIHIEKEIGCVRPPAADEEGAIQLGLNKSKR